MKKILLIIATMLFYNLSFSQTQDLKIKKIISPQYGKIPSGKTTISMSDSLIVVKSKDKTVEFKISKIEDTEYSKTYISNHTSQNDVRFTFVKKENYLRFENKDNFTGRIGELIYYFE